MGTLGRAKRSVVREAKKVEGKGVYEARRVEGKGVYETKKAAREVKSAAYKVKRKL